MPVRGEPVRREIDRDRRYQLMRAALHLLNGVIWNANKRIRIGLDG